jgi:hypothetical protein
MYPVQTGVRATRAPALRAMCAAAAGGLLCRCPRAHCGTRPTCVDAHKRLLASPPPPPHTPSPHTHTHTTTHTHTHTGAYEVHSLPSKRVGLYAPHGGTLIARSDTNGEDLEAFAGAGLYDRCVRVSCAQSCAVLGNCVRGGVTRRGDACPSAAASLCLPPPKLTPRLTPATHAHTHTHTHTHTLTH